MDVDYSCTANSELKHVCSPVLPLQKGADGYTSPRSEIAIILILDPHGLRLRLTRVSYRYPAHPRKYGFVGN
jgi:hypothetical protein